MEVTPLMLYLCFTMDSLLNVFKLLSAACVIAANATYFYMVVEEKYTKSVKIVIGWLVVASVFLLFIAAALPTTKQTAIIFGVPYMMNTLKESGAGKIPPKIVEYAEIYIDKELLAMKKELDQSREKK